MPRQLMKKICSRIPVFHDEVKKDDVHLGVPTDRKQAGIGQMDFSAFSRRHKFTV